MSESANGSRRSFLSSILSLVAGAVAVLSAGCTARADEKKKPEPVDKYGGRKPATKYGGRKPATKYGGRKKDTKDQP